MERSKESVPNQMLDILLFDVDISEEVPTNTVKLRELWLQLNNPIIPEANSSWFRLKDFIPTNPQNDIVEMDGKILKSTRDLQGLNSSPQSPPSKTYPDENWNQESLSEDFSSLTPDEAGGALVEKSLGNCNAEDVSKLSETLCYLPLALQQALAYMNNQNQLLSRKGKSYKIRNYLKEYKGKVKHFHDYKISNLSKEMERIILTTWKIPIQHIRRMKWIGPSAIQILCCLAYLQPEEIPIDLLKQFVQSCEKIVRENRFEKCLDLLNKYSLVRVNKDGIIKVHILLQKMTQIDCNNLIGDIKWEKGRQILRF